MGDMILVSAETMSQMKQLVCVNQCIAIAKVGCEVGILCGSTWAAVDETGLCKVFSAVAS